MCRANKSLTRNPNFCQKRHTKLTKIISYFIDYETRSRGFASAASLKVQILDIFNEYIGYCVF